MTDLAAELADPRWGTTRPPWDGYERNVGYGVMNRPFSSARLRGRDLGGPVTVPDCPTIGGWRLPRRGVLATGGTHVTIGDSGDHERLRRTARTPRGCEDRTSARADRRAGAST